MKQIRLALLVVSLITISTSAWAKPRSKAEMAFLANKVFNKNVADARGAQPEEALTLVLEKEAVSVYASKSASASSSAQTGRFAIVSNDDILPEVLGYSNTVFDPELKNSNFCWWLETMNAACKYRVEHNIPAKTITPGSDYKSSVDPLCTSQWGQDAPYNNMCPIGTSSSWWGGSERGRCITGCVATSMAQILYYQRCPKTGQGGTYSVRVKQSDDTYATYTVNYDEAVYDYENMLDSYKGKYSEEEADAVALLMYHCGVAADMDYATDGSGTYHQNACDGLNRNFGFNDATYYERKSYSEQEWMNMIFNELSNDRPLIYGGDDMSYYSGHSFVFDGYDEDGKAHVNWGWEGEDDGFYDVATLYVDGYSWSDNQDMIIGIGGTGSGKKYYAIDFTLDEAGTLADYISESQIPLDSIAYITLAGSIDNTDMATIRNIGMKGALRKLDLKNTVIADCQLPDSAFAKCDNLRNVNLPSCVTSIGNYAFACCKSLKEMRLYNREKPEAQGNVFKDVDLSQTTLLVRAGTKTVFSRSIPWKNFGTIGEFGVAISARNCSRNYGEPNPEFYYSVEGGSVDGEPLITCDATEDSPAGTYTLHTNRGTVLDPDVDFVDGFMIVTGGPDAIENVQADSSDNSQSPVYDLSGRRLNKYPAGTIVITNKRLKVLP